MAHFALICPPFYSHIRVFEAIAAVLAARGHQATFVLNAGGAALLSSTAPAACSVDGDGADLAAITRRAARPNGPLGILRTVSDTADLTAALCRSGPALLRRLGVDAVIGDQMEPAAGLLAASLQLPQISLAAALPVNGAAGVPLPFLDWPYDPSPEGLKRNRGGEKVAALLLRRQRKGIEAWSEHFGLTRRSSLQDCLSPLLQISQCPAAFDFPRPALPAFHAVGPIRPQRAAAASGLPFPVDPKRPFVFASLGTLQGHRLDIFQAVAKACRRLGAQLLVAHCGGLRPEQARSLDADFVTDFADQAAVLDRADACVTHGGMNTVLDALARRVPLLVIPIAFDQPGIAARVVHHGIGRKRPRRWLTAGKVEADLGALIGSPGYRAAAEALGPGIGDSGGAARAADLIEAAIGR